MAYTDINSEDRLVQATFAEHLEKALGWESVYAWKKETFGPDGTLGRTDKREAVLTRELRAAIVRLNPQLPISAVEDAVCKMTRHDFSRSLVQHNQEFHGWVRDGVPVSYRDAQGQVRDRRDAVIRRHRYPQKLYFCTEAGLITDRGRSLEKVNDLDERGSVNGLSGRSVVMNASVSANCAAAACRASIAAKPDLAASA